MEPKKERGSRNSGVRKFPIYYVHKKGGADRGHFFFDNSYRQCANAWKDAAGKWKVSLMYPTAWRQIPEDCGSFETLNAASSFVADFYSGVIEEVTWSWMRDAIRADM